MDAASYQRIVSAVQSLLADDPRSAALPTFKERVRAQIQHLLDEGGIADGDYPVRLNVGARQVVLGVRVQSDLFGGTSLNLDTAALDEG